MTSIDATGGAMMVATGAPSVAQDSETGACEPPSAPVSVLRFWAKVDRTETCWLWTGYVCPLGYGRTHARPNGEPTTMTSHRFAWDATRGPLGPGMELDHLCNNPACVRPDHLEPVTHAENMRRAVMRRTACRNGHTYTPDNTFVRGHDGVRGCKTCLRQRRLAARARGPVAA